MPAVEKTMTFNAPIEKVYQALEDFEAYPSFVDGVSDVTVTEKSAKNLKANYQVNMVKEFKYSIDVKLDKPNGLSWKLIEGNLFKKNNGSWKLKKIDDNKTEVTYGLEVEFKLFAPKMLVNKMVKTSLPAMMEAFHQRAKSL